MSWKMELGGCHLPGPAELSEACFRRATTRGNGCGLCDKQVFIGRDTLWMSKELSPVFVTRNYHVTICWCIVGFVQRVYLSDTFPNPSLSAELSPSTERGGHVTWVKCVSTMSLTWLQCAAGVWDKFNSLGPGDAYLRQWTGLSWVACGLPAPIHHLNQCCGLWPVPHQSIIWTSAVACGPPAPIHHLNQCCGLWPARTNPSSEPVLWLVARPHQSIIWTSAVACGPPAPIHHLNQCCGLWPARTNPSSEPVLWLVACPAPIHHLNQYWIIVRWAIENKHQWIFNQ